MPVFFFDIGNVLTTFDFQIALKKFLPLCRLTQDPFQLTKLIRRAYEGGEHSTEELIRESMKLIGFIESEAVFREHYNDIFAPIPAMWATVERLAPAYPLYLFSNTSELHKEHLFERYPVFHHFRGGIYSYSARSMKPQDGMYEQGMKLVGVPPEEIIYIDDLPANIETGRKFGWQCWQYDHREHEAFEEWLKSQVPSLRSKVTRNLHVDLSLKT